MTFPLDLYKQADGNLMQIRAWSASDEKDGRLRGFKPLEELFPDPAKKVKK